MINTTKRALIAGALSLTSLSIEAAGFRLLEVNDSENAAISVGLWYPSDLTVPETPNTDFGLSVALDAPISVNDAPLIVISHGYGGWYGGHADTAIALADAGFVVAAPSHTGNTWSDMSSSVAQWAIDRPRHVSRVIDHLLAGTGTRYAIDSEKVGVYGFSAGGYTALGLIGGVPDFDQMAAHCQARPEEFVCAEGMAEAFLAKDIQAMPTSAWGADSRISAAVISAPGLGFAYTARTLKSVTADIQLWSGDLDTSVPTETNAEWLADQLPIAPETHWVENANHFAFMTVACREAFKQADPVEYELVCGDALGFDRREFHVDMHREMIRFFNSSFSDSL